MEIANKHTIPNAEYLYQNGPQARALLYLAKTEVHVYSRGLGKTQGLIANKSRHNVFAMPKSTGVFVTKTFRQALSNTLPPVLRGWADMGYVEGIDFVVGIRPPSDFDTPHLKPQNYKYCISWKNGTVIHLISQDRIGSANGLSIDWIIVDECKLINKERFDQEVMPANRGNRHLFGHRAEHHSVTYCTDRWYGVEGNWIGELEKQVDPIRNRAIETYAIEVINIEKKLRENKYEDSYIEELKKKISKYNKILFELRSKAVLVSYANALENIHILGIDYIEQQRQLLPKQVFLVTVMNEPRNLSTDPFYPNLSRISHCYNKNNNQFLDALDYNFDALDKLDSYVDDDLDPEQGLYIGIDPGGNINVMVVGQFDKNGRIRVLNSFYVKKPDKTRHLIEKMCEYYKHHQTKEVYYYLDQTHIGSHGAAELTYEGIIKSTYKDKGWDVGSEYFGKVPDPEKRYILASNTMELNESGIPGISFNESNCEYLLISMESADTEEHKGLFRKDKSSEKSSSGVEQEEATHFSDAFDTLLWGMHHYPHPTINSSIMKVS